MTFEETAAPTWHSRKWRGGIFMGVLILVGVAVESYLASTIDGQEDERWVNVHSESLVHTIGLSGKIEPHRTLFLTAPFDGNVLANRVEHGQRVEQGQVLLTMDPALLEVQLREALSAQLKTRRIVHELQNWHSSAQVTRARRTLRTAELSLSNLNRNLRDSQKLLERGIIPRNELDDLQQQAQMQKLELAAVQSELQEVLAQGDGEYRQMAEMELQNATVKLEGLQALLDGRNVIAPFSGIVVPLSVAQRSSAGAPAPIQAGTRVSQGQVLFGLADIEQLNIVTSVSELDINQLKPGQAVDIQGDGFDGARLVGSVAVVSSLAEPADESDGSARFAVTMSVPELAPEQLQRVRLGMSTNLTIITYRNDQAIIIPPEAILHEGSAKIVEYRKAIDQPVRRMTVTTGRSTLKGVEVFGVPAGWVRLQI